MTHRFSLLVVAVVGLSLSACDSGSPADAAGDPAAPPDFPEMTVPENVVVDGEVPQTPDALPEANRYIVVVGDEPAVGNARARAALEAVTADVEARPGTQVVRTYEAALAGFVVEMDAAAAADLAQDPRVESVEPDLPVSILATQNGAPWGLDRIDQRSGTNGTYTYDTNASNVTAYVIDTGIRT
ncbi:MAG: protease inhibitor I9 family protein, partial [Bacteroidota bacterium]